MNMDNTFQQDITYLWSKYWKFFAGIAGFYTLKIFYGIVNGQYKSILNKQTATKMALDRNSQFTKFKAIDPKIGSILK